MNLKTALCLSCLPLLALSGFASEPTATTPSSREGWALEATGEEKVINIELPSKDLLALRVPIFAYTLLPEYRIQEGDIATLASMEGDLAALLELPLGELVQPVNQAKLRTLKKALGDYRKALAQRIAPSQIAAKP
jgi:hypothetical protein